MNKITSLLTPKNVFFGLLLTLVALLAGSGFLYIFFRGQLENDVLAVKESEEQIELNQAELVAVKQSIGDFTQNKELLGQLEQLLPEQKLQSEAIALLIEIFSNENDIPISSLSFENTDGIPGETSQTRPSGISGVASLPISISITDPLNYNEMLKLLRSLEKAGRHTSITQLTISPEQADEDQAQSSPSGLNVSIKLNIQLQAEEEPAENEEGQSSTTAPGDSETSQSQPPQQDSDEPAQNGPTI